MAKLKPYTVLLNWGEQDEGQYHWAGRAKSDEDAERRAREAMDHSYNDEYCDDDELAENGVGIEAGKETTEYEVVECIEGVNEYAAMDMLKALRVVAKRGKMDKATKEIIRNAIRRGEGYVVE